MKEYPEKRKHLEKNLKQLLKAEEGGCFSLAEHIIPKKSEELFKIVRDENTSTTELELLKLIFNIFNYSDYQKKRENGDAQLADRLKNLAQALLTDFKPEEEGDLAGKMKQTLASNLERGEDSDIKKGILRKIRIIGNPNYIDMNDNMLMMAKEKEFSGCTYDADTTLSTPDRVFNFAGKDRSVKSEITRSNKQEIDDAIETLPPLEDRSDLMYWCLWAKLTNKCIPRAKKEYLRTDSSLSFEMFNILQNRNLLSRWKMQEMYAFGKIEQDISNGYLVTLLTEAFGLGTANLEKVNNVMNDYYKFTAAPVLTQNPLNYFSHMNTSQATENILYQLESYLESMLRIYSENSEEKNIQNCWKNSFQIAGEKLPDKFFGSNGCLQKVKRVIGKIKFCLFYGNPRNISKHPEYEHWQKALQNEWGEKLFEQLDEIENKDNELGKALDNLQQARLQKCGLCDAKAMIELIDSMSLEETQKSRFRKLKAKFTTIRIIKEELNEAEDASWLLKLLAIQSKDFYEENEEFIVNIVRIYSENSSETKSKRIITPVLKFGIVKDLMDIYNNSNDNTDKKLLLDLAAEATCSGLQDEHEKDLGEHFYYSFLVGEDNGCPQFDLARAVAKRNEENLNNHNEEASDSKLFEHLKNAYESTGKAQNIKDITKLQEKSVKNKVKETFKHTLKHSVESSLTTPENKNEKAVGELNETRNSALSDLRGEVETFRSNWFIRFLRRTATWFTAKTKCSPKDKVYEALPKQGIFRRRAEPGKGRSDNGVIQVKPISLNTF